MKYLGYVLFQQVTRKKCWGEASIGNRILGDEFVLVYLIASNMISYITESMSDERF
jgi:hypothetical protein